MEGLWQAVPYLSKIYRACSFLHPTFLHFTCKSQICSLGGYLLLFNEQILLREVWNPWRPWVLKQSLIQGIAPPLEMFPSPVGLRATVCWVPGRGRTSAIGLIFLDPPATTLNFIFYSLMTWSFFRSIQSQNNMSTRAFVVRATMMRNMAKIIISFHFIGFYFVFCFLFTLLWLRTYFLEPNSSTSHSLHTLTHLFFLFPRRSFDTLKSVLLDMILCSYPVFLPFLPSRFLLISHKESVSRQTSVTE